MKKLHEQIKAYIIQYHNNVGFPPSTEEIGAAVGLKSKSAVCRHLKQMDADGIIRVIPGQPRCISVPGYAYVRKKWISASNPPEHGRDVLIQYTNGDQDVAYREGGRWRRGKYLTETIDDIDVEKWRPLEE